MADNLTALANTGTGTDVLATDEIGGVHYPRTKVGHGEDGSYTDASNTNPLPTEIRAVNADFAPNYNGAVAGRKPLLSDPRGALVTRSTVLTDEGSSRINFANTSLAVSLGSATLTNGSRSVTGSGFLSTIIDRGDYIKLDADTESAWAQVDSIDSDTALTLVAAYTGTGGTSNASRAMVRPVTGSGGSIAVSSGACTLTSGTTINAVTAIERLVDYSPLSGNYGVTVSQRIANNETFIEFRDPSAPAKYFMRIRLTGTTNTSAICETGYNPTGAPSAAETESTTVRLPNGATSATARVFRIESILSAVRYYCDNVLIAEHRRVGPHLNDFLLMRVSTVNGGSAPASSTTVTVDHLLAQNFNATNVSPSSQNDGFVAVTPNPDLFSGSATANNTDLVVIDCAKYRELWITSSGTFSATLAVQGSNTPDFTGAGNAHFAAFAGGSVSTSITAAGMFVVPVRARWYRIRTTAYTSGTPTVTVHGSTAPGAVRQVVVDAIGANVATVESGLVTPTAFNLNSAATTNATAVKASAGTVYAATVSNTNAAARFLKLYNRTTAPTVGTDIPIQTIPIPATGIANIQFGRTGHRFTTGIAIATTTGMADADATAVAAGELKITLSYI